MFCFGFFVLVWVLGFFVCFSFFGFVLEVKNLKIIDFY